MAKEDKHQVRNGIIIGVVTGLILLALGNFIFPFLGKLLWWSISLIGKTWTFLIGPCTIPTGVFILLVILSCLFLFRFCRAIRARLFPSDSPYSLYTEDEFHGVLWRWDYASDDSIAGLACYCTVCESALTYSENTSDILDVVDRVRPNTSFYCPHCGVTKLILGGRKRDVLTLIRLEIDRRIRTGEWKQSSEDASNKQPQAE